MQAHQRNEVKENEHLEHRYEFTAFTYTHVMEKHIYIYISQGV